MAYTPYENRTFFDKVSGEEGDSTIYVGISYLKIVAQQINDMRMAMKEALRNHEMLWFWLHELRVFYDLVESRTGLEQSEKEIDADDYKMNKDGILERIEIKIKEKVKYEHWFAEIEGMLERNYSVMKVGGGNPYLEKKYLNNKKIITELSQCYRELMRDANKRHLIMPEGMKDMKALAKQEWIDREVSKVF